MSGMSRKFLTYGSPTVMPFSSSLGNAKISALVIGNEKHQYQPKKDLSVKL